MRTETKNELRQQLNNALADNRRLKKEVKQIQDLDMPERLYLSTGDICVLLDLILHDLSAVEHYVMVQEEEGVSVSDAARLRAMYQYQCKISHLQQSIESQCRAKYEWNAPLQTHEAVSRTEDKDSEMTND
tara:strand:+ start:40 stop:432 length:393 start_codon:yes stop_codon:yes gene_type:complete